MTRPTPAATDMVGRDTSPLPPSALVRFQRVSRGKLGGGYAWVLHRDGHVTMTSRPARGQVTTEEAQVPAGFVGEVERALREEGFPDGPATPQLGAELKDGDYEIVGARLDGIVREVVYVGADRRLLDLLGEMTTVFSDDDEELP